jgi:hypothetical protein
VHGRDVLQSLLKNGIAHVFERSNLAKSAFAIMWMLEDADQILRGTKREGRMFGERAEYNPLLS